MLTLLFIGGIILFAVVVIGLAELTVKYSQKHNSDFWWS
jgi:hypothetical protein